MKRVLSSILYAFIVLSCTSMYAQDVKLDIIESSISAFTFNHDSYYNSLVSDSSYCILNEYIKNLSNEEIVVAIKEDTSAGEICSLLREIYNRIYKMYDDTTSFHIIIAVVDDTFLKREAGIIAHPPTPPPLDDIHSLNNVSSMKLE